MKTIDSSAVNEHF